MTILFRIAALILLVAIAFATLAPIGLRPQTGHVNYERFFAFAGLGLVTMMGFPRRFWLVFAAVLAVAIGLEFLQLLTATRHGRLLDAAGKVAGGAAGVLLGQLVLWLPIWGNSTTS